MVKQPRPTTRLSILTHLRPRIYATLPQWNPSVLFATHSRSLWPAPIRLVNPASGDRQDIQIEPGTPQCINIDVIVTHTLSTHLTNIEASLPGRMVEKKVTDIRSHYSQLCQS